MVGKVITIKKALRPFPPYVYRIASTSSSTYGY